MSRIRILVFAIMTIVWWAGVAHAQPAPDPVTRAKELFRQGVELHAAGDRERALQLFIQSREAFPSVQNTSNVAVVLDELGRYDEALEVYEFLLVEFKTELNDEERAVIAPSIAELRSKVGSVFVSANVHGKVVIDGRPRAELPLNIPIRVLPGKRQVRVIRNGYVTWEKSVDVEVAKTVKVDAVLEPLADAGLLRVDDATTRGAEVFVDGAVVGATPWEGTVGPGEHVVWTQKGNVGSVPKKVVVVQGQTALVQVTSQPLGGTLEVVATPRTATIFLDGVKLGAGRWSGRLPIGGYELLAREEGYFEAKTALEVDAEGTSLQLKLEVDAAHPRWPNPETGEGFIQVSGGVAFGPRFGAQAETTCATCPDDTGVLGFVVSARGGYRFPFGMALEVGAGYLRLGSRFERVSLLDDQVGVTYPIQDDLLLHGPLATVGLSYRYLFGEHVGLGGRIGAGAFFEFARDDLTVEAAKGEEAAELDVIDDDALAQSISVFAQGDAGLELVFGSFQAGVTMGVMVFLTEGAIHEERATSLPLSCDPANPGGVGCIRTGATLPDERSHDIFFVATPQIHLGYAF